MCRNIKTLFNFEPPATEEEIRAASLQFVRKLSGFNPPSKVNEAAFDRATDEVTAAARLLVASLVTNAGPRNRETEAVKARERNAARFGATLASPLDEDRPPFPAGGRRGARPLRSCRRLRVGVGLGQPGRIAVGRHGSPGRPRRDAPGPRLPDGGNDSGRLVLVPGFRGGCGGALPRAEPHVGSGRRGLAVEAGPPRRARAWPLRRGGDLGLRRRGAPGEPPGEERACLRVSRPLPGARRGQDLPLPVLLLRLTPPASASRACRR